MEVVRWSLDEGNGANEGKERGGGGFTMTSLAFEEAMSSKLGGWLVVLSVSAA